MALPKKIRMKVRKYLVYSLIGAFIVLVLMMLKIDPIKILTITLLIVLASVSKIYKQFTSISVGFELITPITILFAYELNIMFAIISAIIMVIAGEFVSGKMNAQAILFLTSINVVIAVLAGMLGFVPFVQLAWVLIILRNVLLFFILIFIGGLDIFRAVMATAPNVFINGFIVNACGLFFTSVI